MTTFLQELEKYADLEKAYLQQFPDAQPLGNFYQYFGLTKMMEILSQANGREIKFYLEKDAEICIFAYA
jgi:hypothetical protein